MSLCQIVVWGYKHSISAAALPPGADLQIFMRSLKLVEIPLARGANSKGVETIAIAAGDSIPNMSLQTSPILCRRDENGVFRSAVKKVCVDDIFDAASSVESTALQALLPVSGCRSFIEACISLADFVRVGLPNTLGRQRLSNLLPGLPWEQRSHARPGVRDQRRGAAGDRTPNHGGHDGAG